MSGVVEFAVNILPVPSSLMVPRPVTGTPPGLVATKLKVSPAEVSRVGSFATVVRTNKPPAGICTKLPSV